MYNLFGTRELVSCCQRFLTLLGRMARGKADSLCLGKHATLALGYLEDLKALRSQQLVYPRREQRFDFVGCMDVPASVAVISLVLIHMDSDTFICAR